MIIHKSRKLHFLLTYQGKKRMVMQFQNQVATLGGSKNIKYNKYKDNVGNNVISSNINNNMKQKNV